MAGVACAGAPAAMANEGDVTFSDACGDNHAFVRVNDIRQEIPATPRTPRFDLKAVTIGGVDGGVAVSWSTCEAPGEPDPGQGGRGTTAWLSDDCWLSVYVQEPAAPTQPREGHVSKHCSGDALVGPSDSRFDVTLPADAITVAGDTLTLTINRAGLTGEAAAALAPGTSWQRPGAFAQEGPWVGGGGGGDGFQDSEVLPTGVDFAAGDYSAYVVQ